MQELRIDVENIGTGLRVFRLTGPLTLGTLFELQDLARATTGSGILIELSGVPYMDSAGLGVLLGAMDSCQRRGRGFGITGAADRIQTLFRVSHVDGLIPTFDSVEAAGRRLSESARAASGSSSA